MPMAANASPPSPAARSAAKRASRPPVRRGRAGPGALGGIRAVPPAASAPLLPSAGAAGELSGSSGCHVTPGVYGLQVARKVTDCGQAHAYRQYVGRLGSTWLTQASTPPPT